jgi:hypothetical protein
MSNIELKESAEKAEKESEEIKRAFKQIDEARFTLNKIMGPNGVYPQDQRLMLLNENLTEHDELLGQQLVPITKSGTFGGSQMKMLQNNPSRAYFNSAGIAGNSQNVNQYSKDQPGQMQK